MPKDRKSVMSRFLGFFTYHPFLKIIALALAIIVWLYVKGEIAKFNF